jgi:tRNA threonylcarbamoyladenosine biosynthesis protein TsaE
MWKCKLESVTQTRAWAACLNTSCVIAIDGPLGSGKTVFAQGIGQGLGIESPIVSPTFIIANQYSAERPFLHIDLYRIEDYELRSLGLEEEIEDWDGIVLVEWASKHPSLFPTDYLKIQLEHCVENTDFRIATVSAIGNTRHIIDNWKAQWSAHNAVS